MRVIVFVYKMFQIIEQQNKKYKQNVMGSWFWKYHFQST